MIQAKVKLQVGQWSISVSRGHVIQIWRGVISPRETRTFLECTRKADYTADAFNTRPVTKHPCQKPFVFYMSSSKYDRARKQQHYEKRRPSK
ncbi:hypothetical protein Peur_039276 [Populus x canadensis]